MKQNICTEYDSMNKGKSCEFQQDFIILLTHSFFVDISLVLGEF